MIDVSNLTGAGVRDVPAGHFFGPAEGKDSQMFLGGFLFGERVLVELQEMRVAPAGNWVRPSGYAIGGTRIEVDPKSASPASGQFEPGAVMLVGDRLGIVAQGNDHQRYVAAIDRDEDLPRESGPNDVAFTRWQAVIGTNGDKETVFSFGDAI